MEGSPIPVLTVPTAPYEDQRPAGGGGLRRPTGLFEGQRNYLPNFIQSVLSSIDLRDRQGCTMVVGSDGRYFSRTATEIVVQMAAANGTLFAFDKPGLFLLIDTFISSPFSQDLCSFLLQLGFSDFEVLAFSSLFLIPHTEACSG
ncbi:phosphoglucomutase-1 [Cricetulus griseus]|nr:phosphoglucomutase-1 [Cricetulus griseus]